MCGGGGDECKCVCVVGEVMNVSVCVWCVVGGSDECECVCGGGRGCM